MNNKKTAKGGVILPASDSFDTVNGYLVRFTAADDADLHGEHFSKATDFWLERGYPVKGQPVLLEHGLDNAFKWIPVGIIESCNEDEIGLWIEARLHDREYYEQMLREMASKGMIPADSDDSLLAKAELMARAVRAYVATGKVGWSSGALPQSVAVDENGAIKSWAVIEGSITMTPAEPDGTDIAPVKSALQVLESVLLWGKNTPAGASKGANNVPQEIIREIEKTGDTKMTFDEIIGVIQETLGNAIAELQRQYAEMEAARQEDYDPEAIAMLDEEELDEVEELIADAIAEELDEEEMKRLTRKAAIGLVVKHAASYLATRKSAKPAKSNNAHLSALVRNAIKETPVNRAAPAASKSGGFSGGATVGKPASVQVRSKFAHWTAEDFSFAVTIANKVPAAKAAMTHEAMREFADKALSEYQAGKLKLAPESVKTFNAIKSNEVMYSTQAGFGDEWVPTEWANAIWDKPRTDLVAPNVFEFVDMPSNPYEYPVMGADPTVYYVAETTNQAQLSLDSTTTPFPPAKAATAKTTFTARKLGTQVFLSAELAEDAIAVAVPALRQQTQTALLHAVDSVIFNGDTATTGNINSDGETITATNRSYLAMNGLIKQALVTASTNALDASGAAPSLSLIRSIRALLAGAVSARPSDLALIMDVPSYIKLLNDGAILTMDKYGDQATVLTGELGKIDGISVFASEDIFLADSDGKITETSNVVNRGRMLLVHRPSWKVGYRRRPVSSMEFLQGFDVWSMVVSTRFDLAGRTEGASDDTVAILYNIGV